jgi:hypothetical protein
LTYKSDYKSDYKLIDYKSDYKLVDYKSDYKLIDYKLIDHIFCFPVTPNGIWPQQDVRVRFSYLEEEGKPTRKRRACILGSCQAEMATE